MSLTLDEISFIININNISRQIYRYVPIVLFLFGIIGNFISCLVFIQRALRTNPCCIYFLTASISNLIFLTTLLSPMLNAWNETYNLINTISGLCKFTMLIILMERTLALWFIVLATIDRYLVSSANINRRQLSHLKQSYRCIIIACVLAILIWIESIFIFYLTITFYKPKTLVQEPVNGFIFNIVLLIPFLSSCISFLLYKVSGKIFRQTFVQLGKK